MKIGNPCYPNVSAFVGLKEPLRTPSPLPIYLMFAGPEKEGFGHLDDGNRISCDIG
jgi:hypothetical protein